MKKSSSSKSITHSLKTPETNSSELNKPPLIRLSPMVGSSSFFAGEFMPLPPSLEPESFSIVPTPSFSEQESYSMMRSHFLSPPRVDPPLRGPTPPLPLTAENALHEKMLQLQGLLFRLSDPATRCIKPRSFKQAMNLFSDLFSQGLPQEILSQLYCWKGALYALKNRRPLKNNQEAKQHLELHLEDYCQVQDLLSEAQQLLAPALPKHFEELLEELVTSYIEYVHQVNYSGLPEDMNSMLIAQAGIRSDKAEAAVLSALPHDVNYLMEKIMMGCLKVTKEGFTSSTSPQTFAEDTAKNKFAADVAKICLEEIQEAIIPSLPNGFDMLQQHIDVLLDILEKIKTFQNKINPARDIPKAWRSSFEDYCLGKYSSKTLIETCASFRLFAHANIPLNELWTTAQTLLRESFGIIETINGQLRKESPRLTPTMK